MDVTIPDDNGDTVLMLAIDRGAHSAYIKSLIRMTPPEKLGNMGKSGATALSLALERSPDPEISLDLIEKMDPNDLNIVYFLNKDKAGNIKIEFITDNQFKPDSDGKIIDYLSLALMSRNEKKIISALALKVDVYKWINRHKDTSLDLCINNPSWRKNCVALLQTLVQELVESDSVNSNKQT